MRQGYLCATKSNIVQLKSPVVLGSVHVGLQITGLVLCWGEGLYVEM